MGTVDHIGTNGPRCFINDDKEYREVDQMPCGSACSTWLASFECSSESRKIPNSFTLRMILESSHKCLRFRLLLCWALFPIPSAWFRLTPVKESKRWSMYILDFLQIFWGRTEQWMKYASVLRDRLDCINNNNNNNSNNNNNKNQKATVENPKSG